MIYCLVESNKGDCQMGKKLKRHKQHTKYRLKKRFGVTGDINSLCSELTSIIKNSESIFVEYQKCNISEYERELHMVMFHGELMYVVYEREVDTPITVMPLRFQISKHHSNEHKKSLITVIKDK